MRLTATEVATATGGSVSGPEVTVDGAGIDSRLIRPGQLFVAAGATTVYVGPNLPLAGPPGVVTPLANHDNHLHARIAP